MNNAAYIDWPALLLLLAALGWTAYHFSRRTYRITVMVAAIVSIVGITEYGANSAAHSHATDFIDAFKVGSNGVIETMLKPLAPRTPDFHPGLVGWCVLLVVCAGCLIWFDTWSARRQQPRVEVAEPPTAEAGRPVLTKRRGLTEELRFRLPAVCIRRPASTPGGLTLDNLASMVAESEVKGGKLTAALMRVVHALEGQPHTYEARMFVEPCTLDGHFCIDGSHMRVTVDLQDARTGETIAVQMLPTCLQNEVAERAAGFAARQVFHHDPSTPDWAVGSPDGQDLSAYLLSQEICAAGPTLKDLEQSRREREEKLEQVVKNSPAPGLVGYELAAMYDMDGEYLKSLLLHLRNRVPYPRFWAGRSRLAVSLSTLAWPTFDEEGQGRGNGASDTDQQELARVRTEIGWHLRHLGLLDRLAKEETQSLEDYDDPWDSRDPENVSKALLHLAEQEFRACGHAAGAFSVLWNAFWHRNVRSSLLQTLRSDLHWLHPRRRRLASSIAIEIAKQRRNLLVNKTDAEALLNKVQQRTWNRLGMDKYPAGRAGKVPWHAVYNAACLFALSSPGCKPNVPKAIELLRRAVNYPACDLEHPSEWIRRDPDLRPLNEDPDFKDFVDELVANDFENSGVCRSAESNA